MAGRELLVPRSVAFSAAPLLAFVLAGTLLIAFASRGGGSYDVVARQEVTLVVWCILALGFAAGVLPRGRSRLAFAPIAALALLGAWTALSLIWTQSDERTFTDVARVVGFAGVMLLGITALDRSNWRAAASALVAVALGVCVLAVVSRLDPASFPRDTTRESVGGARLNYPFNYWNAVGAWCSLSVALGLAWSAHARTVVVRMLCLAAVPAAVLCAYMTYSRAAIGGVTVAVLCVWAFSRARLLVVAHTLVAGVASAGLILVARDEPAIARGTGSAGAGTVTRALVVAAVVCAVVALITHLGGGARLRVPARAARAMAIAGAAAALVVLPALAVAFLPDAWDSFKGTPPSTTGDPAQRLTTFSSSRYYVFDSALNAFEESPLKGTGSGTFEFTWNQDATLGEFVRDGHSIFLEPMSELGLPGLLLFLAFVGSCFAVAIVAWKRSRRSENRGALAGLIAAFAAFTVHASVDWTWESTAVAALAVMGVACAAASLGGPARGRAILRPVPRIAAALASVLAVLLMLPGLASTTLLRQSQTQVQAGDLGLAYQRADQAIEAAPWSASAYAQRGLVHEARGRLEAARSDLLEAQEREPENWRFPFLLARVEAERGDAEASVAAYRRGRRLRPRAIVFLRLPAALTRRPPAPSP